MQHTRQSALDLSRKRPPRKQYVESAGTFLNKGPSGDKKKKNLLLLSCTLTPFILLQSLTLIVPEKHALCLYNKPTLSQTQCFFIFLCINRSAVKTEGFAELFSAFSSL